MDTKAARIISDAMAARRQEQELLDRIKAETWTESEVRELLDLIKESQGSTAFAKAHGAFEEARRQGRVQDDLTPTVPNIQARLGKGAWTHARSEVQLLSAFGTYITNKTPEADGAWAIQSKYLGAIPALRDWVSPHQAIQQYTLQLGEQQRLALEPRDEVLSGLLWQRALPTWAGSLWTQAIPRSQEQPGDDELVQAQAQRFEALGTAYSLMAEVYRTTPGAKGKSVDEVMGIPQPDGARWRGFRTREAMRQGLSLYRGQSRMAIDTLKAQRTQIMRGNVQAVERAVSDAVKEGVTVIQRDSRWAFAS